MTEYDSHTRKVLSHVHKNRKIALILGSDPLLGEQVAAKLQKNGYKSAIVSCTGTNQVDDRGLFLQADLRDPDPALIFDIFMAVERNFMGAPSLIIYNADASMDDGSGRAGPSHRSYDTSHGISTVPLMIALEAMKRWELYYKHGSNTKLFVYTGKVARSTDIDIPLLKDLGIGGVQSSNWIEAMDGIHTRENYRFIYADQRDANGNAVFNSANGSAHGSFYAEIAKREAQNIPWHATFVEDKGYVKF